MVNNLFCHDPHTKKQLACKKLYKCIFHKYPLKMGALNGRNVPCPSSSYFQDYEQMYAHVKASGFDSMTQGSAVRIPAVAELSFGIKLTFWLFVTLPCQEHWQILVTQLLGGALIEFQIIKKSAKCMQQRDYLKQDAFFSDN